MGKNTFVELCRSEEDWIMLREVFVRSFLKYPLYEYMVRDDGKRAEFLRRYLNAHYNIHVRSGRSPVICIRTVNEPFQESSNYDAGEATDSNKVTNGGGKIVGGVLFVAPARNGIGWDNEEDGVYAKAYTDVKLYEVDRAAFERLQRYETWETKHVTNKLMALKIPLWNGMFCAVDPAYSRSGCGSESYADCMEIVATIQAERQRHSTQLAENSTEEPENFLTRIARFCGISPKSQISKEIGGGSVRKLPGDSTVKLLHAFSLLNHHGHNLHNLCSQSATSRSTVPSKKSSHKGVANDIPMVIAFSHSQRAVQFHRRNGFHCINETPYPGSDVEESPFSVHVLINDMFGARRLNDIAVKLDETKKFTCCREEESR